MIPRFKRLQKFSKRAAKYDPKLALEGSFENVIRVSVTGDNRMSVWIKVDRKDVEYSYTKKQVGNVLAFEVIIGTYDLGDTISRKQHTFSYDKRDNIQLWSAPGSETKQLLEDAILKSENLLYFFTPCPNWYIVTQISGYERTFNFSVTNSHTIPTCTRHSFSLPIGFVTVLKFFRGITFATKNIQTEEG